MDSPKKKRKKKSGPKPEHLKIDCNWEDAVGKAIKKEKPEGGWPNNPKQGKKP